MVEREQLVARRCSGGLAAASSLVTAPCFFATPDGVAGPLEDEDDIMLFSREVLHHASFECPFPSAEELAARQAGVEVHISTSRVFDVAQISALLDQHGCAVLKGFLGDKCASTVADDLLAGDAQSFLEPAFPGGAKLGGGRGDLASLPDILPVVLLESLDQLMLALRRNGGPCGTRLEFCEFRSWPMLSAYPPGTRYTWHLDNAGHTNGRLLTCVYYLNRGWTPGHGGALRLFERQDVAVSPQPYHRKIAEVVPDLDTLVLFWSDQVPHEVLPPRSPPGAWRHAVSIWYLCPRLGSQQFVRGTPLPVASDCDGGDTGDSCDCDVALAARAVLARGVCESEIPCDLVMEWLRQAAGVSPE
eukprot:TRINITY_DN49307_c0_g1_i1.p1 TRINITY_DN49307_c0_g1~~TRINITY_DN49307_c0_g1_i1.p1  ORF type:complete len:380 (-),score=54.72 TRINITY_DN49307_c0_g1_i1:52-1131(-)